MYISWKLSSADESLCSQTRWHNIRMLSRFLLLHLEPSSAGHRHDWGEAVSPQFLQHTEITHINCRQQQDVHDFTQAVIQPFFTWSWHFPGWRHIVLLPSYITTSQTSSTCTCSLNSSTHISSCCTDTQEEVWTPSRLNSFIMSLLVFSFPTT